MTDDDFVNPEVARLRAALAELVESYDLMVNHLDDLACERIFERALKDAKQALGDSSDDVRRFQCERYVDPEVARLREQVERLEREMGTLIAVRQDAVCVHCGLVFKLQGTTYSELMTNLSVHAKKCSKNPIVAENARLCAALARSIIALDDWMHIYAPEHCQAARVSEAQNRIGESGTLAYIADVQRQNRLAIGAKP